MNNDFMKQRANSGDSLFPSCPICSSGARHIRIVTPELSRLALAKYFGGQSSLEHSLEMETYCVLRCCKCTLEYADPRRPGSRKLYEELGKQPGYYPSNRWEWGIAIEKLRNCSVGTLIDAGCGAGLFLKQATDFLGCTATGIDTNPHAVATCRTAGLQVYCETIEDHLRRSAPPYYDCAVAFHCIEHVEDPLEFASSLFGLVRSGGFMLLSTPLSPLSFEHLWYDPLNNPPHHLTRWNEGSYVELARCLQADLQMISPPAPSPQLRAARAMALAKLGTPQTLDRFQVYSTPFLHPIGFIQEIAYQLSRAHINSTPAGDALLRIFRKH